MSKTTPVVRHERLIKQEIKDGVLLYDLDTNKAYSLNHISAKVWQSCDGKTSVEQIAANKQIPIEIVQFAIDDFDSLNLLEKTYSPGNQVSRRVIVEMGIAAGISIPMVLSVLAPTALMAASVAADTCGSGIKSPTEQCDDGNTVNGDGCSATCNVEPGYTCSGSPSTCSTTCGDGIVTGAESCDDGNNNNADGCSSLCLVESGFTCSGQPSVCVGN